MRGHVQGVQSKFEKPPASLMQPSIFIWNILVVFIFVCGELIHSYTAIKTINISAMFPKCKHREQLTIKSMYELSWWIALQLCSKCSEPCPYTPLRLSSVYGFITAGVTTDDNNAHRKLFDPNQNIVCDVKVHMSERTNVHHLFQVEQIQPCILFDLKLLPL